MPNTPHQKDNLSEADKPVEAKDVIDGQIGRFRNRVLRVIDDAGNVVDTVVVIGGEVVHQGSKVSGTGIEKIAQITATTSKKLARSLGIVLGGAVGSVLGFFGGTREGLKNDQKKAA